MHVHVIMVMSYCSYMHPLRHKDNIKVLFNHIYEPWPIIWNLKMVPSGAQNFAEGDTILCPEFSKNIPEVQGAFVLSLKSLAVLVSKI